MTGKLLLPVRVPELGPALGRLPDRPDPARPDPFDPLRLRLVTRLLDAAGEARRWAANGEREAALSALASPAWLDAWEEAVSAVADVVLDDAGGRLDATAQAAGMGRRRRARLVPSDVERRGVAARFGAAGAGLVSALDRLDAAAAAAAGATAREREAMDAWHDGLLAAARRLEGAWDALCAEAREERAMWEAEIARAAAWRAPWWPVAVGGVLLLGVAAWLGAVLGGYLAPPAWFVAVWEAIAG